MGGGGGEGCAARLFFFFFPCSADHERDWPPCKVVFFGLATNALNVRNNNNNCFWIMKILIIMVLCCARFNYCIGFVFIV